ncbi:MAG TPA: SprT family zinc-dependent metalloprotease [Casimicrobiaceae bacterium]|nr:SprT family zinc-dependent metalloprotease [Casimicrobiaceae bacterium]
MSKSIARLRGDNDGRNPRKRKATEGQLRRVVLNDQMVDYRLIRARRRSIGMEVHFEGLTVRAPRWVSLRDIDIALIERATWIVRSLAEWRARKREVMPSRWATGAPIVYRGRELRLALFPARRPVIEADMFNLTIRHPSPQDEPQIESLVAHWLRDQAWALIATRVPDYAQRVGMPQPSVRLSNARSEWGSCNAKGEIRLNWRLVQLPPPLAEYVVAHEVAHIIELNHSPRFWSLVETLLPGHADLRRELEDWTAILA